MTIQQAFEKAIEGAMDRGEWTTNEATLLKPLFWQSLGKAMGLAEEVEVIHSHPVESDIVREKMEGWKWWWHRFIDHLTEGKDTESFFESL